MADKPLYRQIFVPSSGRKTNPPSHTFTPFVCNERQSRFLEEIKISPLEIEKVIFNNPATIVFWTDGSKTVVKTSPNDKFDKEKGILWAYAIKNGLGSKTQVQKEIMSLVEK